ncbi:hypothetical protein HBI56_172210 [Parastagonospora nodorum]|nr:hypothetical protein HBH56_220940 [Parastagonospora nodorum]KAH3963334.1 hypothetical protein HBH51_167520 [Parastagonospora nodorum]KAH3964724.1 hypothetical protein HBH52_208560 [Parastagonospora nodorum]KAH3995220.1 hypothetical protein HBI10_176060 [Parastagonospora nodorum]KAH4015524.1 hypothetical protein HBI09_205260 [Parastagonospora nodorum]
MIIDYETDASGELSEMVIAFRDSGRQDKERHENRLVAFAPKCLNFRNKVLCRCPPRGASYSVLVPTRTDSQAQNTSANSLRFSIEFG